MKKEIWFLLINYLLLSLLFLVMLSGCYALPEVTARVELNVCEDVKNVWFDPSVIPAVHPYLEVSFNDGDFRLSSSSLCFGLYIFNAFGDTLYSRNFKVLGKNSIELFNVFNLTK